MTEKERIDAKMAALYELRLMITNGDKKEYTVNEMAELLDQMAREINQ